MYLPLAYLLFIALIYAGMSIAWAIVHDPDPDNYAMQMIGEYGKMAFALVSLPGIIIEEVVFSTTRIGIVIKDWIAGTNYAAVPGMMFFPATPAFIIVANAIIYALIGLGVDAWVRRRQKH